MDAHALSPKALQQLRWKIEEDEQPNRRILPMDEHAAASHGPWALARQARGRERLNRLGVIATGAGTATAPV